MDKASIIKDIVSNFAQIKSAPTKAKQLKKDLIPLCISGQISEDDFYKVSSLLSPQSRSPLWEKYFIAKNGCKKVNSNENAGDFIWNGVNYEYKVSCNDDKLVHMVQIRLWQNCDYIIQAIQPKSESVNVFTFKLSHAQMLEEAKLLKAVAAHGTKHANLENTKIELRATFKIDSPDWERWMQNYQLK